ncbi:MAG: MvdC/MvdD family ATP grasp protein [Chloroflexota bacterium]
MGNERQILIVTREFDPHADEMLLALRYMRQDVVRLNLESIPTRSLFALDYNGTAWINKIVVDGRPINVERIGAVWWRRPGMYHLPDGLSQIEAQFAIAEINQAIHGFWGSMHCYWMSHPHAITTAQHNPEQLYRACHFGFTIPRTLVTTNPAQAHAFYESCAGKVVFRVMSDPALVVMEHDPASPEQVSHATPATRLAQHHLEMLDSICMVPCMFQEAPPMISRLYVVLIEEHLFAVEAQIQLVDGVEQEVAVEPVALDDALAQQCIEYIRSYNLQFSVLTFMRTKHNQLLFTEHDPTGQFMWIQHEVPTFHLIELMAQTLIDRANR